MPEQELSYPEWETKLDALASAVWSIWTRNIRYMDDDLEVSSRKSAVDAVADAYQAGMSDAEWTKAALGRLTDEYVI